MSSIRPCPLPAGALLGSYAEGGAYTDCYTVELSRTVTQREFVEAFYTTSIFKVERWLISTFLSRPSSDAQARQLAAGESTEFAAWSVEQRTPGQLLLATGRTRSWLMVAMAERGSSASRLYFGSAVVPSRRSGSRAPGMGWQFRALLGFHKLYSRVLLAAACRKLVDVG